ncbi:MAG: B12-binding domain-containing radical SAM protein [Candidatus Omnitrophica bacterium]|nr:B12-binding domain-containing radical SAM protein [Candidatus Omnitrophota bacterium]
MKVLLLSPAYLPTFMRNGRCDYLSWSNTQWFPIWLSYCGALLVKHRHSVFLIDAPAQGWDEKQTFDKIIGFAPELLVVYSSTQSIECDVRFAEKVKNSRECKIVLVGPFVSLVAEKIMSTYRDIDACVQGEFEYPVLELANGVSADTIKNLVGRKNGELICNPIREVLDGAALDAMPFVTRFYSTHLDIRQYKTPSEPYPFVDFFTGRGCSWGHCTFCLWPHAFFRKGTYTTRSVDNVIEEIKYIKTDLLHVKGVFIQDDTFPQERAMVFSEALLANDLKISWSCYARGELDYEAMCLMKRAGCRTLHVGYESKDNEILRISGKGLSSERMTEFTADAHKAGLRIHGDFLLGFPGEDERSMEATIAWAKKLNPHTAQFLKVQVYPGTALEALAVRNEYKGLQGKTRLMDAQLSSWIKKAYRTFYLRPGFLIRVIFHPREYIFLRLRSVMNMMQRLLE